MTVVRKVTPCRIYLNFKNCLEGTLCPLLHMQFEIWIAMLINVDEITTGARLTRDLYHNKCLLLPAGTILTEAAKRTLKRFKVSVPEDDVQQTFSVDTLTPQQYYALCHLDLDDVIYHAEQMVNNLVSGQYSGLLHLVFDYDECTFTHSKNVTLLALLAGIEMQYSIQDLTTLAVGSLLHDIGKLQVPLDILDKPTRLSKEEFNIIKRHPSIGYGMVDDIPHMSSAVKQIILQHHENYDGTGYPRAIDKCNGYRLARLVHICDVYEALCARRPYKSPMPRGEVRDFIQNKSGTMFDPKLVSEFLHAVPAYLVGEELVVSGVSCVVVSASDSLNPVVNLNGTSVHLEDVPRLVA